MESYLHESGKLDGSNFTNWKFKIQTLLEGANAWSVVRGDEQRSNSNIGTQEQEWDKRENKAKVFLKMSVKDDIIPHIK